MCQGVHKGSWSEAAVCLRVRGQINGTWKTKNTVRRCWHSYSSVNISQGYALIVSTQISSLTYKHTGPSMVQSNVWVIELCHCSFVIADTSLHSLCARTMEWPYLSCCRSGRSERARAKKKKERENVAKRQTSSSVYILVDHHVHRSFFIIILKCFGLLPKSYLCSWVCLGVPHAARLVFRQRSGAQTVKLAL